jgi:PTH1 family peptidyl-tRNA hydrolase
MSKPKIIFGLGNSGDDYASTYHNAGRLFADFIAEHENPEERWKTVKKDGFEFVKTDGLVLIKSLGFMNESGRPAKAIVKYFKYSPKDLVIAHDDSDINLGSYKISKDRGSAGHKGVQSVIDHLKTREFERIRIGVRPQNQKKQAGDFVLKPLSKKDEALLKKAFLEIRAGYLKSDDEADRPVRIDN